MCSKCAAYKGECYSRTWLGAQATPLPSGWEFIGILGSRGSVFLHNRHGCTKRLPGRQTMGTGTKTNRTMKQVQCRAGQPPSCRKFRMLSVVLLLTRGSLHCIVPNDEIMKFNKWSVVKFIFHRLVRYLCFPDLQGWSISHLPSAVRWERGYL